MYPDRSCRVPTPIEHLNPAEQQGRTSTLLVKICCSTFLLQYFFVAVLHPILCDDHVLNWGVRSGAAYANQSQLPLLLLHGLFHFSPGVSLLVSRTRDQTSEHKVVVDFLNLFNLHTRKKNAVSSTLTTYHWGCNARSHCTSSRHPFYEESHFSSLRPGKRSECP